MICTDHKRCSSRPSADRPKCDLERFSSWPFVDKRKLQSPLPFSAALRVLRGQRCCRCRSSWPYVDKCVAVAVLRGPPCPPRTKVLPLQFFVFLRGPSWPYVDKCVAGAVLRGPPCPPRTKVLPLPFFAALRVLRGQMCCRCRSPRPSVSSADKGVAVAVLRGPPCPPRTKVLPLQFFAGPPWLDQFMIPLISVQTNVNEP